MRASVYPIIALIVIADLGTLPLICWAWVRFVREDLRKRSTWLSVMSLLLATGSAILGIAAFLYSKSVGGFPFYDPRLMRIYFYGGVLSLAGALVGAIGLFFKSSVRWQAPLAAVGTLLFWIGCAAGE